MTSPRLSSTSRPKGRTLPNRLLKKIENSLRLLATNPYLGRVPNDAALLDLGYRYLVVQNYLIFYVVEERTIFVHRIVHGARDYLGLF